MSPEPRRSVQYTQGQLGECVRRDVLALDGRDAAQPQRLIFRAVAYYRVCGVSILPEKSQARKQAPHPKPSHGSGTPMQQQHSVWAKHGSQARVRVRQEHAPRPHSAVLKCRPVRERYTRRGGIWCTHRRRHTRYMIETLATFHLLMSALNVGHAISDG
jgi:hypothetical protein